MAKFHFISKDADILPVAYYMARANHDVVVNVVHPEYREFSLYENILPIEYGLPRNFDKDRIIIYDETGFGDQATALIKKGYQVIGAAQIADKMENDREFAIKLANACKINIPKTFSFKHVSDYKSGDIPAEGSWFVKFDDKDVSTTSHVKSTALISEKIEELIDEGLIKPDTSMVVQQAIEGVEISTEMWFSHGKPLFPLNSTFEDKRLLAGNIGPNTGCMGSVVFNYQQQYPRLYKGLFKILSGVMGTFDYTGPIDINVIVSYADHYAYFLEFTPRFGYSALYAWLRTLSVDWGYFFEKLVSGELRQLPVEPIYSTAITTYIQPFPSPCEVIEFTDEKNGSLKKRKVNLARDKAVQFPVELVDKKNVFMTNVYVNENKLLTCGFDGVVAHVIGTGKDENESIKNAYENVKKIVSPPNLCYRNDIGARVKEAKAFLNQFNYEIL